VQRLIRKPRPPCTCTPKSAKARPSRSIFDRVGIGSSRPLGSHTVSNAYRLFLHWQNEIKIIIFLAVVLSGVLFGCSSAPKVHGTTLLTSYDGEMFDAPRKLKKGSATLPEVYMWANSVLATNYPLITDHADIFQAGSAICLLLNQPGGNRWKSLSGIQAEPQGLPVRG